MKEKDIKIGDYFAVNGEVVKVQETELCLCGIWDSQDNFHTVGYEDLEPIPLTKEILEKNGWEKCDDGVGYYNHYLLLIPAHGKVEIYVCGRNHTWLRNVAYVHELQHILWALGIDDNLKL